MQKLFINTDGGSRGNPGPAGIGIVFYNEKEEEIFCCNKFIGVATNNEAEYGAIILALETLLKSKWLKENNSIGNKVVCRLDSQLVVEQINGNYKVKQDHLKKFIEQINTLKEKFNLDISFLHVFREKNKRADELVNQALDEELKQNKNENIN